MIGLSDVLPEPIEPSKACQCPIILLTVLFSEGISWENGGLNVLSAICLKIYWLNLLKRKNNETPHPQFAPTSSP